MTCLEKQYKAARILEDRESTSEQKKEAQATLMVKLCNSCSNPLVGYLGIDDLLCDNREF